MIDPDGIDLGQQGALALLTVYALDYVKRSKWCSFISVDSERLNRAISLCVSLLSAAGLSFATTGSVHAAGTLSIAWNGNLWSILGHAGAQFLVQEVFHKQLAAHTMQKQILAAVAQLQLQKAPEAGH